MLELRVYYRSNSNLADIATFDDVRNLIDYAYGFWRGEVYRWAIAWRA